MLVNELTLRGDREQYVFGAGRVKNAMARAGAGCPASNTWLRSPDGVRAA